jgi:hypothetical protein
MHYDGSGAEGWLACLATSPDLVTWTPRGRILQLGRKGSRDSGSASYATTYFDGRTWHGFYVGTPNVSPAPDLIPLPPYLTMKATGASPTGPWKKDYATIPFSPEAGTYYSCTASPGQIIKQGKEYLMFFSPSAELPPSEYSKPHKLLLRSLGIARTRRLNGAWKPDPNPILPLEEQIENSTLYFEEANQTWFLFTNHVGVKQGKPEYTDAVWVYWSKDLDTWDPVNKAVVLDSKNCRWSPHIIGLPSVLKAGRRLAVFYDGHPAPRFPPGPKSHMDRDIGLAWLDLPLRPPQR